MAEHVVAIAAAGVGGEGEVLEPNLGCMETDESAEILGVNEVVEVGVVNDVAFFLVVEKSVGPGPELEVGVNVFELSHLLFAILLRKNHKYLKYKIWKLMLGPNIVITNRNVYILPEFHNVLSIYKDYFVMYNEWTNQVKINSLNNLSIENPFVNTRNYTNSLDEKRTFIGLRGSVKGFGYDVNFSQLVSHSNSQFVTNYDSTTLVNEPMFDVHTIYKLKAWNPHITLSYNKGSQFGAKVWFDYFVYNKNTAVELSYTPSIKAGFSAFYNWKDKLLVNMDIEGRSKVNAVQNQTGAVIPFVRSVVPIKGLIDINFSANYFITKNIGVFVDVNNVAFQKWQRYYNYPTYQFQVIAGAKLSF